MTTLAVMKARIADELWRDDLSTNIEQEINSAINFYRSKRFYFTEKRTTVGFNTVAGQSDYGAAASAYVPHLIRIDSASITVSGVARNLDLVSQLDMELMLTSNSSLTGQPDTFSYYAQELRFYPKPADVYPVKIAGVVRVAAPASDSEANNPWMTDAEELIRARAKRQLYLFMMDPAMAQAMAMVEQEALDSLRAETSSRTSVNYIIPDSL